jgi:phage terminase large subunit
MNDLTVFTSAIDVKESYSSDDLVLDVCEHNWDFLDEENKTPVEGGKKARVEILYGGGGSGKSYTVAQYLVTQEWQRCSGQRWYVIRKTSQSLKTSCYALVKELCNKYDIHYDENKTDKNLIINGNEILFRGVDDPEKIKSTDVNSVWIEEATELNQDDFEQLDIRARLKPPVGARPNKLILTFNPISKNNWLYKHFFHPENAKYLDFAFKKSTYLDNPFLDKDSVRVLENFKKTNPMKYNVYALAMWGQTGKLAYESARVQRFNKDLAYHQCFYVGEGLDWGYIDPNVILKLGLDKKRRRIYIFDEVYVRGVRVGPFAKKVAKSMPHLKSASADSARPENIIEFNENYLESGGVGTVKPVKKKRGSKEKSYKVDVVGNLNTYEIIIHPDCENAALEILDLGMKPVKGSENEYLDELIETDDHCSDALIYWFLKALRKLRGAGNFSVSGIGDSAKFNLASLSRTG